MTCSRLVPPVLAALALVARGIAAPADLPDSPDALRGRFVPAKPTIVVKYNVSYRFLFLTISRLACGTVEATEGLWRKQDGSSLPAALLEMAVDTPDRREAGRRDRMSIHNRILSVLTMPDLDSLVYMKDADEILNPLFGSESRNRYVEVYDFEGGALRFRRIDALKETVQTNLVGASDLVRQGKEIPIMLKIMSAVYNGQRAMLTHDTAFRIHVNIDGVVTPFGVVTRRDDTPVRLLGQRLPALRVDVSPAPEAHGRGRTLELWTASFADVADYTGDTFLIRCADEAPDWNMIPLVADYGLAIGYVRGYMTSLSARPMGE
jgi:hypothetical protein